MHALSKYGSFSLLVQLGSIDCQSFKIYRKTRKRIAASTPAAKSKIGELLTFCSQKILTFSLTQKLISCCLSLQNKNFFLECCGCCWYQSSCFRFAIAWPSLMWMHQMLPSLWYFFHLISMDLTTTQDLQWVHLWFSLILQTRA